VGTAAALQEAVQSGWRDIVVTDHLDLRSLDLLSSPATIDAEFMMYAGSNTRSIRVRLTCDRERTELRKKESLPLASSLLRKGQHIQGHRCVFVQSFEHIG
jgi:hypothetical protein